MPTQQAAERKAKSGGLVKIPFNTSLALATLADAVVLQANVAGGTFAEDFRVTSIRSTWTMRGATPDEGPIMLGYNHGDYTVTEVKENIESQGLSPAGKIEREQANRLVRQIGAFQGAGQDKVLNDGKPIRTKLNWIIQDGIGLEFFAMNQSGAILTTGSIIELFGTMYGFWIH